MKRKRIQKLPAPTKARRVETGAVQFGEDWPGLFIRGDDAMNVCADLERLAKAIEAAGVPLISLPIGVMGLLARLKEMIDRDVFIDRIKPGEAILWEHIAAAKKGRPITPRGHTRGGS